MFDADGRIKVMDFGLAKLKHDRDITKTGSTVGTLAYSSPEQIRGEQVGPRSDLFSLGIVLYEMLAGAKPFRGEHQAAMTYAIVNEDPASIKNFVPEAPDKLERFFRKALAKDPQERFGSAGEMKEALEALKQSSNLPEEYGRSEDQQAVSTSSPTEQKRDSSSATITISLPGAVSRKIVLGRKRLLAGIVGLLVLMSIAGWWVMEGGVSEKSAEATTGESIHEAAGNSIAVMPFHISGSGAEEWRDGMVTALGLNLDGAAGLRAIPSRTIFAELKKRGITNEELSMQDALEVAQSVGARYAVVGEAVQLGQDLRFATEIHETRSRERLGQVGVRGPPDSVTVLTNQLTREILGVLMDKSKEAIPSVKLESITTSSLESLKAFIDGERHFRRGEYETAIEQYEKAVRQDSAFALAYARLAPARGWVGRTDAADQASRRAYQLSNQLPPRERRVAYAVFLWRNQGKAFAARDTLRELSRVYPGDPSVWYQLGETIYHGNIPRGLPEAEEAFGRAVDLDPGFAQYHHHLVELAFVVRLDSSLAAERIAAHPEGARKQMFQLALDLVFGPEEKRREALSRLDRLPRSTLPELRLTLRHPTRRSIEEQVLRRILRLEDTENSPYAEWLVISNIEQGKVQEALRVIEQQETEPVFTANILSVAMSMGMPVPDTIARRYLAPENLPNDPSADRVRNTGIYLIERNREEAFNQLLNQVQGADTTNRSNTAAIMEATVQELKGYRAWKAGNLGEAKKYWSRSIESPPPGAVWRGDLYREIGELKKAEGWYLAAWEVSLSHERLGQLYEEMGQPEKAVAAYERFIAAWENADEPLQDRVKEARKRMEKLEED